MKSPHAVFLIICFTLFFCLLYGSFAFAEWSYPGWTSRREVILDNSQNPNTLYGFQIKMTIPYYRRMQSDFDDLRFAVSDGSGTPLLPYWVEEFVADSYAIVYTKVVEIPANGMTRIYVYYGNSNAQSESNGEAVFDFFDDFNDQDISDWSIINGSWTASNSFLEQMVTANHRKILSSYAIQDAIIVESDIVYLSSYPYSGNHIFFSDHNGANGYKFGFAGLNTNGTRIARIENNGVIFLITDPTINVDNFAFIPLKAKVTFNGAGFFTFLFEAQNGVTVYLEAFDAVFNPPWLLANYVGSHTKMDNLRARKFANPEPFYSIGKEENNFPWNPDESEPQLTQISPSLSQPFYFRLHLPKSATISASIYDCLGRKLSTIKENLLLNKGKHMIAFDKRTEGLTSGPLFLYMNVAETNGRTFHLREKIILIK